VWVFREKKIQTEDLFGWAKIPNHCEMNLGSQQALLPGQKLKGLGLI
jgi:hypothetical protein